MERQFHKEDFERLLRDNANQYRMYPSEKVWKGVYSALHTRRRWYRLSALLLLLISTSLVTINILEKKSVQALTIRIPLSLPALSDISSDTRKQLSNDVITASSITNEFTAGTKNKEYVALDRGPVFNPVTTLTVNADGPLPDEFNGQLQKNVLTDKVDVDNISAPVTDPVVIVAELDEPKIPEAASPLKTSPTIQEEIMALSSQNAPIQVKGKTTKLTAQLYFTPTISYRKLTENKAYSRAASMQNPGYTYTQNVDVNSVVNHKPAMGVELGFEGRYAITERIAVKVGGQFNINRYDISAYFHPTEFATIALNSGSGPDSVISLSNYRNFNGPTANWLENFYFTASVPIGVEFIAFDNKKIQWGVSGSVQPSYVIGDRAYLISKDYKNYAKVPNLMRRWNMSTDFETFISYSTGRLRWQVGPQVRYQHLSSFVNEYPVKENLFDIGLKVGASLNKR